VRIAAALAPPRPQVWVACGRANAFAIGLYNEGGKPW